MENPPPTNAPTATDQPQAEKRRRTGKDTTSHGPTLEVALVDVDLVVFGRFEIKAWFPSPYVIDQLEYRQAIAASSELPHQSTIQPLPTPNNPLTPRLKRHSNGRFQKKLIGKRTRTLPPTINTSPANSTPPLLQQDTINKHRNQQIQNRSPTPDSLSSLQSESSSRSAHWDPPQNTLQLPVPPNHLYPTPHSHPSSLTSDGAQIKPSKNSDHSAALKLYVCDGCLRYLLSADSYLQHKMRCGVTHPPGRKVYQSGRLVIREVDGSSAKLYCQCLCLFGKLFIDHKYIFFDVEGFKFYVLTTMEQEEEAEEEEVVVGTGQVRETIVGFFSKEKVSYDGYNLACIVTLPPYQRKGYGTLLIEFSYELDRYEMDKEAGHIMGRSADQVVLGTPERPLSTMGARGYLRFWTAVLVRFFRTLFTPPPPRLGGRSKKSTRAAVVSSSSMDGVDGTTPEKTIEITLEEISRSTRLRPDDVAFALISSGLAKSKPHDDCSSPHLQSFIITPNIVEHVARTIKVKNAVLDPRHVLLQHPSHLLPHQHLLQSPDSPHSH
ncbi:hypothetical protein VP01_210g19 [Puccinia sorghi]|uniref:histone acetyltransferase n=1 Tax=Puccinia sorghi TaxID=27349 RepID=A0A0L6VBY4_9BASI|nr:hypothetical protein VP01_210g19 [Puccinia sorghi]